MDHSNRPRRCKNIREKKDKLQIPLGMLFNFNTANYFSSLVVAVGLLSVVVSRNRSKRRSSLICMHIALPFASCCVCFDFSINKVIHSFS